MLALQNNKQTNIYIKHNKLLPANFYQNVNKHERNVTLKLTLSLFLSFTSSRHKALLLSAFCYYHWHYVNACKVDKCSFANVRTRWHCRILLKRIDAEWQKSFNVMCRKLFVRAHTHNTQMCCCERMLLCVCVCVSERVSSDIFKAKHLKSIQLSFWLSASNLIQYFRDENVEWGQ